MSLEKEQVKAEELEAEESSIELEDSDLEEVAGGAKDAEQIAEESNQRYRR